MDEKINLKVSLSEKAALAAYLGIDKDDISVSKYDSQIFEVGSEEYLVVTDEEADERAKDYILESAWAFKKSFLDGHSDIIPEIDDKAWAGIVDKCESVNGAVLAMIKDKQHFVEDAIACDGRGHFLAGYDFEENQEGEYFIYRIN